MSGESSPELAYLLDLISDGEWHDGLKVARVVERTIEPGEASRYGAKVSKSKDLDVLVRAGRRERVQSMLHAQIERQRIECDRHPIGRDGWSGVQPWRIRDLRPGWVGIGEVADLIDLNPGIVRTWVKRGYIPSRTTPAGVLMFTPADVEIIKRVAAAYPGPGKHNWAVPPRTLWVEALPAAGIEAQCPHCHETILLNLDKP